MFLSGKRIFLRLPVPDDVALLYKWENDKENRQFSSVKKFFAKQEIKNFVCNSYHDIYLEKQLRLMICTSPPSPLPWERGARGELIGCIDLFDFDSIHLSAEIGILTGEKKQRGNRYASEALRLLIRHCFRKMNLRQLCCHVSANNKPALSLFLKHGFRASPQTPLLKERDEGKKQKNRTEIYFLRLLNKKNISAL